MEEKLIKETKDDLAKKLKILLSNQSILDHLKKSNDFQVLISKELDILTFFVMKANDDITIVEDLVKKYNFVVTKVYVLNKDISFIDVNDIQDDINYLNIYVKNIFKVDIKDISSEKTVNTGGQNATNDGSQFFNNPFGGINFGPNSQNITIPNPILIKQAQERVREKIDNDAVFVFKTKPKHIPKLKWVYGFLCFFMALTLLCICVLNFMLNNKFSGYHYNDDNEPYYFHLLITGIFGLVFFAYFMFFTYRLFKSYLKFISSKGKIKVSENEKYKVNSHYIGFSIFVAVMLCYFNVWPDQGLRRQSVFVFPARAPLETLSYVWGLYVSVATMLALCVAMLVVGIILIATKPKDDVEALRSLFNNELNNAAGTVIKEQPINLTDVELPKEEVKN